MAKLRFLVADGDERGQLQTSDGIKLISQTNEQLVWRAVALACEGELHRLAETVALGNGKAPESIISMAEHFRTEKVKVLEQCRAHAQARVSHPASAAPLSFSSRSVVTPTFEEASSWQHPWADAVLRGQHSAELRKNGFCVLTDAFDIRLAQRCLAECDVLDAATTVTTNPCNCGSRSIWLEFNTPANRDAVRRDFPALFELASMLTGLPHQANELQALEESDPLRVHPAIMVAAYPEHGAQYVLHKDSYAPRDNDPSTGATRRLTVLAYLNDWRPGDGGELRLHDAVEDQAVQRRFRAVAPRAGSVVVFDSPRVWHAVAPSLRGSRWAVTLWVH